MLSMRHKKAVTTEVKKRYIKETKKGKTTILDEFIALTGYNRTYAARMLSLASRKSNRIWPLGWQKNKICDR